MSLVEEHFRYLDYITTGRFKEAEDYRLDHNIDLKDLCAPANKHCLTQPVYAAIKGFAYAGTDVEDQAMEYIKTAIDSVPGLMDIVSGRVNVLSHAIAQVDNPKLVQYLIDQDPSLINDQSMYYDDQTNEYGTTFKMYRPTHNSPTHDAVNGNRLASLDVLIKNGADVNLKNKGDITPLDYYLYSCKWRDAVIPTKLLDAGGEVTTKGYSTISLYYAIKDQCWTGLNNFFAQSDVKIPVHYYTELSKGAVSFDNFNYESAKTLFLALDNMSGSFDVAKFAADFCPTVAPNYVATCNETFRYVVEFQEREQNPINVRVHSDVDTEMLVNDNITESFATEL